MYSILNLPVVLVKEILSDWVGLRDIVHLESALVHDLSRIRILQICFPEENIPHFVYCKRACSQLAFLHWLVSRNLFVSKVLIPVEVKSHKRAMASFFRHAGCSLQCIEHIGNGDINEGTISDLIANHCTNVKKLNLSNWDSFDPSAMDRLLESVPLLRYLNFSDCCHLCSGIVYMIMKYCSELRFLSLQNCICVGGTLLGTLLERLPKLQHLVLGGCEVMSSTLCSLPDNSLQLVSISFRSNRGIVLDDGCLIELARTCPNLSTIDLSNVYGLSNFGIEALVQRLNKSIKVLHLRMQPDVNDALLQQIAEHCPNLTHLSISHCLVTDTGVLSIAQACQKLQCLDYGQMDEITITEVSIAALGAKLIRA